MNFDDLYNAFALQTSYFRSFSDDCTPSRYLVNVIDLLSREGHNLIQIQRFSGSDKVLRGCYCPFKIYLFLKFSKAHNFDKIHRRDMGLTLMLTLIDALQNDVKVKGQISVLIVDLSLKPLLFINYRTYIFQISFQNVWGFIRFNVLKV